MAITIHPPGIITPRLLPGLEIDGVYLSIGYSRRAGDNGRTRYDYHLDGERWEYSADDLQSGIQGGTLQEGLCSLLSFLSACGEGRRYSELTSNKSENAEMFPDHVAEWCASNSDELDTLRCEIEEGGAIIEEQ